LEITIKPEFPEKLGFLFEPHRYKVMHGGRGGAKSWGVARALLIQGLQTPLRILCTREFQNSIKDSVHKLLSDQVLAMQSFISKLSPILTLDRFFLNCVVMQQTQRQYLIG